MGETFGEVLSRRGFLKGAAGVAVAAAFPGCATPGASPRIGFTPIAASSEDLLRVPPEYEAKVLFRWGDPVGAAAGSPEFRMDASNSAADQALQAGMHHDGMHFFPLSSPNHGLLAMNHEYLDQGLLFPDGMKTWSAEKVLKAQNAVGVSVIEVKLEGNDWKVVRPSSYARRITARTPCRISGPAAGHALMRTSADPAGRGVLGTYNGCAHGWTPWGTYLTCEENWHVQFVQKGPVTPLERRYRIGPRDFYRWAEHDERFDVSKHPNEANRFGWIVEIDPHDPSAPPVKRTALGRIKHEGAASIAGPDRRVAFYMGDDEADEYIYKFVTARPWDPANRAANRDLLDEGTLYAARFNTDGTGDWLPLSGPDPAAALVDTRGSADAAGATRMDRPEWIVPHPVTREVYASLSNSAERKTADAANPRAPNPFGHILRWREQGDDPAATRFRWDVFALAGPEGKSTIRGDHFACPDGLWFDSAGVMWVQTDMSSRSMGRGDFATLGNNQALAVDPATGVFRRFLTGPRGCEITAFHTTPDNRTAFVNIQHPGETPGDFSDPEKPRAFSNWPDYSPQGRPRSSTVVIRRKDGGIIGT